LFRNLASKGIAGEIPMELGDISSLQILKLRANQLNGTIPSALGDLSNLTNLDLSQNLLSGKIPSSLADLPLSVCTLLPGNTDLCRSESFAACEGL
jgi:Leucine-rich repeat (LRR) protein